MTHLVENEGEDKESKQFARLIKLENAILHSLTKMVSFFQLKPVPQMLIYQETDYALEMIDSYSRLYFPLTFFIMMFFYWMTYLYWMPDEGLQM